MTPRWVLLAVLLVAAAVVYGPLTAFSYPEFSDFALNFGHHAGYSPLGVTDILGKYVSVSQGWYRPTSFYAVPYVLRLDYFEPGGIMAANIAFFCLAAFSVALLVRRAPLASAFAAATSVLFAPALYLVPYGAQIDSLYVLFGIGFIAAMLGLQRAEGTTQRRVLWAAAVLAYLGAITSKEIGIIAPFLLVPALVLTERTFSWTRVKAALRTAAPFMLVSVAFVVVYKLGSPSSGGVYSAEPSLTKLPGAISLTMWSFGFRSVVDDYSNWIPPWSSGEKVVAVVSLVSLVALVALGWRELRAWRIGLFIAMYTGLAVAIALPGGLPHHSYPLVVLAAVAVMAAARAATIVLRKRRPRLVPALSAALVALGVVQVVQAHATYGTVLYNGPQSTFIKASTSIFTGTTFAPVRAAENPLFVFEDCLGGLHNPLRYYAKAGDGEEVSVPKFDPSQFAARFRATARQGRQSFVAQCTGTADPFYRLLQYDAKTRQLVPAPA